MPLKLSVSGGALCLLVATAAQAQNCPPPGWDKPALLELSQRGFALADAPDRNRLALNLQVCLRSPDPVLRDQIAFDAYSRWLRGKQLSEETRLALLDEQLRVLDNPDDDAGFARPFAALVLAELARADAQNAALNEAQRDRLVASATRYLRGVNDYRGFDPDDGWRHGVAHGADLLMQLARHPALGADKLGELLGALASQIAPVGEHAYVFGEPERLARVASFVAIRESVGDPVWQQWLDQIASPQPFAAWADTYATRSGLAKRHNTRAFLLALYLTASQSEKPALKKLRMPLLQALEKLG